MNKNDWIYRPHAGQMNSLEPYLVFTELSLSRWVIVSIFHPKLQLITQFTALPEYKICNFMNNKHLQN